MKNLIITKNIMNLITKASSVMLIFYILAILFVRAANLVPLTTDDVSSIFMFGTIVGTLFMMSYSINIIYNACRKRNKKSNYKIL